MAVKKAKPTSAKCVCKPQEEVVYNLSALKCYNSVRVGTSEDTFFTSSRHDIFLKGHLVKIIDKASELVTYTSLYNVAWWKLKD